MKRILHAAVILACTSFSASAAIEAGAADVDITPPVGIGMAGYYSERPAEGIIDPLHAKILVLRDGEQRAAIVALDLISVPPHLSETTREAVTKATGIPGNCVMLTASHTHTAPVLAWTGQRYDFLGGNSAVAIDYTASLPDKIAAGVKTALEKAVPSDILTAAGREESLAFCRRFHMRDGTIAWNPPKQSPDVVRPVSPIDPDVPLVVVRRAGETSPDAKPVAAFVNFAIHLDNTGGALLSSDVPGVVARLLGEVRGPEMVTLYTTGCCGNLNQRNIALGDRQSGRGNAVRIGTILAANALKSFERLEPIRPGSLRIKESIVALPLRPHTEEELKSARAVMEKLEKKERPVPQFIDQVSAFRIMEVALRNGEIWKVPVQIITVGQDLAFVALPGEIFVEIGLAIKQASPFPRTIISELANGSIGYIPHRVAYSEGQYEVVSARCDIGSGELLVDESLKLLRAAFTEAAADK